MTPDMAAPPSRTPSGGIRAFASLRQLLRGGQVPPDRTVVTCGKSGETSGGEGIVGSPTNEKDSVLLPTAKQK